VLKLLLPLRHVAWGSNMNGAYITAYGYGTPSPSPACSPAWTSWASPSTSPGWACCSTSRRAGRGKQAWLEAPAWQGLRRYVEDSFVLEDWFELFVAQNLALDGLLFPLIYDKLDDRLNAAHGPVLSMLTRFQREWYAENASGWMHVLKTAAADNPANKALLAEWIRAARERAAIAVLAPVAELAFGAEGAAVLERGRPATQRPRRQGRRRPCKEVRRCPTPSSPFRRTKRPAASSRPSSMTTPPPWPTTSPPWSRSTCPAAGGHRRHRGREDGSRLRPAGAAAQPDHHLRPSWTRPTTNSP
jgi:hypothetical protein